MISKAFRKNLTTKAQQLRPVVQIGVKGLTQNVQNEVEAALLAHELIKIQVNAADKAQRDEMIATLASANDALIIQQIGHVLVLYKERPSE